MSRCGAYAGYGGYDEGGKFDVRDDDPSYMSRVGALEGTQRLLYCTKNTIEPDVRAKAQAARRGWMQRLGLSEADMADAGALADTNAVEPFDWNSTYDPAGKKLADLNPVDELRWLHKSLQSELTVVNGWLDSLPNGTREPARILFLEQCQQQMTNAKTSDSKSMQTVYRYATWALCIDDVNQLSRAKLDADLAASKADAATRFVLRVRLGILKDSLPKIEADMQAEAAKDPEVHKLIYEVPVAAAKAWAAEAPKYDQLFAETFAMEDAFRMNSRKALEGCHDTFFPWWKKVVGKIDPSTREKWVDALKGSLTAMYVARDLMLCEGQDDSNDAVRFFGTELQMRLGEPNLRGVHGAIYLAEATELATAKFDDRDIPTRGSRAKGARGRMGGGGGGGASGMPGFHSLLPLGVRTMCGRPDHTTDELSDGVIKSVAKEDGDLKITFVKKTHQGTTCSNWESTNKISYIDDQGNFHYYQNCTERSAKTFDDTPAAVTIAAFLGDGVKAGNRLIFNAPIHGEGPTLPLMVMNGDKVVAYLGVAR